MVHCWKAVSIEIQLVGQLIFKIQAICITDPNSHMEHTITKNSALTVRNKFKKQQQRIQQLLQNYVYDEKESIEKNMSDLVALLETQIFEKNSLAGFLSFISHDYNIPIEVNLKQMKADHLRVLLNEWLSVAEDHPAITLQRVYTLNYRNALFKRVVLQEKQTIDDYFQALSRNKNVCELKGFDLYQLLVEILSSHFIYEFNDDLQTFFDKMNSFDTFMKVVEKFVNHDRRISSAIIKPEQLQYVKRFEFQKLIEFWENMNPELTVLQQRRANKVSSGIQTQRVESKDVQIQTSKIEHDLVSLVNKTIHQMHLLFENETDPLKLKAIDRILQSLRQEKIQLSGPKKAILKSTISVPKADQDDSLDINAHNKTEFVPQIEQQNQSHSYQKALKSGRDRPHVNIQQLYTPETPAPKKKNYHVLAADYPYSFNRSTHKKSKSKSPRFEKEAFHNSSRNHPAHNASYHHSPHNVTLRRENKPSQDRSYCLGFLSQIYDIYCDTQDFMDLDQLNSVFADMGIIKYGDTCLIFNVLENHLIRDGENITLEEFMKIMKILMKQSKKISSKFIEQFARQLRGRQDRGILINSRSNPSPRNIKYKVIIPEQYKVREQNQMISSNKLLSADSETQVPFNRPEKSKKFRKLGNQEYPSHDYQYVPLDKPYKMKYYPQEGTPKLLISNYNEKKKHHESKYRQASEEDFI